MYLFPQDARLIQELNRPGPKSSKWTWCPFCQQHSMREGAAIDADGIRTGGYFCVNECGFARPYAGRQFPEGRKEIAGFSFEQYTNLRTGALEVFPDYTPPRRGVMTRMELMQAGLPYRGHPDYDDSIVYYHSDLPA